MSLTRVRMLVDAGGWTGSGFEKGSWAITERRGAPGSGVQSLCDGLAVIPDASRAG